MLLPTLYIISLKMYFQYKFLISINYLFASCKQKKIPSAINNFRFFKNGFLKFWELLCQTI